jgi:hypothetical protein
MAYIKTIPGQVPGETATVVDVFSIKPALQKMFLEFSNVTTFGGSSLGRRREEMLSTYVSYLNRCFY